MKYLCLIYESQSRYLTMAKADAEKVTGEYFALNDDLQRSGQFLDANALAFTNAAATVRLRNGKPSVTDGPYAETKEQLGGYYLLEAKDLNDAIAVAARIPSARWGAIEVRPIWETNS